MSSPAAAQTTEDEGLWFNATVQGPVSGDLIYFAELQPRFDEGITSFRQLLARTAIGWRLSPDVSLYQGYAYVETARDQAGPLKENRSFQQLNLNIAELGRGDLTSRTRLEQRWRKDGDDVGVRLRQQFRYEHPLQERDAPIAALGWVEGFWNLNSTDWGAASGFDRVRTFAGLELPLSGASTVEAGYMNQIVDNPANPTGVDHIVSISLFLRH